MISRCGSDSSEGLDVELAALSEKYNQDLPRVENALWNWERVYPEGHTLVLEYKSPLVGGSDLKQTLNLAKTKEWAIQNFCNSKDSAELIRKGVTFRKILLGSDDVEVFSLLVDSKVCNDQ